MASVDIIVCSYGEQSQKFLNDFIKSIEAQTHKDYMLYVVSSGEFIPTVRLTNKITHKHFEARMHFPEAVNEGVKLGSAKNILLCNDDTILQKNCIENMLEHLERNPKLILNPISCCDNGRFYDLPMGIVYGENFEFFEGNQYKFEQISPKYVDSITEASGLFPAPVKGTIQIQFAAFYCTMMARKTWDDVGGIDTTLKTGQDDLDFAIRAKEIGFNCRSCLNAFCFHYSGATADIHLTKADRMFNIDHFNEKHRHRCISIPQIK